MSGIRSRFHFIFSVCGKMADSQSDTDYGTETDEFSEGEEKLPPTRGSRPKVRGPRYPRPLSNLFRISNKTPRGKLTRRVENSLYLASLYNLSEEEIIEGANIVPNHSNPFTKLHSDDKCMQIWCSFNSRTEEEQEKVLQQSAVVHREEQDTEKRFRRIDGRIRSLLIHNKHLPMELISILEEELSYYFNTDPRMLVVIRQSDSYCRLLVHGICQYLGLHSTSELCEGETCVFVECKGDKYEAPEIGLANYLSR